MTITCRKSDLVANQQTLHLDRLIDAPVLKLHQALEAGSIKKDEYIDPQSLFVSDQEGQPPIVISKVLMPILDRNKEIKIKKINQNRMIELIYKGESAQGYFDGYGIRFYVKGKDDDELTYYADSSGTAKALSYKEELKFILVSNFDKKNIIAGARESLVSRFKEDHGFVISELFFDSGNIKYFYQVHDADKGIIGRTYLTDKGEKDCEEHYNYHLKQKKKITSDEGYEIYDENSNLVEVKEIFRNSSKSTIGEIISHYQSGELKTTEVYGPNSKLIQKLVVQESGQANLTSVRDFFRILSGQNLKSIDVENVIKFIKGSIKTKEDYIDFESKYLQVFQKLSRENKDVERILISARAHGIGYFDFKEKIDNLEKEYDVKILFNSEPPNYYQGDFIHYSKMKTCLSNLEKALATYPPKFFTGLDLKVSILSGMISEKGKMIPGGTCYGTLKLICITEGGLERIFHHELYHYLDYCHEDYYSNNKDWVNIYGKTGKDYPGNKGYQWYDKIENGKELTKEAGQGFLRQYSMTTTDEDQATVAEEILSENRSIFIRELNGSKDSEHKTKLLEKVKQIKEHYKKFDPRMDDKFFDDIDKGEIIDKEYWVKRGLTEKPKPKPKLELERVKPKSMKALEAKDAVKIQLDPDNPVVINYSGDVMWINIGSPYAVFYVEELSGRSGFNWNKRMSYEGIPTDKPLFGANDGLFMWGENYPQKVRTGNRGVSYETVIKSKSGAVLICDPGNYNKIIGKIIFNWQGSE